MLRDSQPISSFIPTQRLPLNMHRLRVLHYPSLGYRDIEVTVLLRLKIANENGKVTVRTSVYEGNDYHSNEKYDGLTRNVETKVRGSCKRVALHVSWILS